MTRARRIATASALVALVACSGGSSDAARCRRLTKLQDWKGAVSACTRAFAATSGPELGLAAARAQFMLGAYDEALRLANALGDGPHAGNARHLVGRIQLQRGEVEAGNATLRESLRLHQTAGEHGGAYADVAVLLGLALRAGRYREVVELTEIAEREAAATGDPKQKVRELIGRADAYAVMGATTEAAPLYREAAGLADVDPSTRTDIDFKLGVIEFDRGNLALARAALTRASAGAQAAGAQALVAHASSNLADIAVREGRLDDADRDLAEARANLPATAGPSRVIPFTQAQVEVARGRLAEAMAALELARAAPPEPEWTWRIEDLAGTIAAKRGDVDGGAAAYRRAIAVIEDARGELDSNLLRASFLHERRGPYERLFTLQVERGDTTGAIATMERIAARTFLDAFVTAGAADDDSDAGPGVLTGVAAVLDRSESLGELLPAVRDAAVLAPIDTAPLIAALRDDLVLSYVEAGDRLWLVVIGGGAPRALALAPTLTELRALTDRLVSTPDDAEAAARLGGALLPDALGPLPRTTIHVVPGMTLARVPFALLRRGGQRLVERHRFVYAPSATALVALRRRGPGAPTASVVLGDGRGDLPGAATEASKVAAVLGVEASVGAAATKERLQAGGHARVLHIATHSGVDARGAWLALAGAEVRGDEVLAWRLAPRLVVLASCASAATTRREYWGSLGAAFLAAGSRAVVASLWSVDDQATAAFMDAFYRSGGADAPAEALVRAQRTLARTYPPGSWSAFVLIGADDPQGE